VRTGVFIGGSSRFLKKATPKTFMPGGMGGDSMGRLFVTDIASGRLTPVMPTQAGIHAFSRCFVVNIVLSLGNKGRKVK
jgi:hypothetical protein